MIVAKEMQHVHEKELLELQKRMHAIEEKFALNNPIRLALADTRKTLNEVIRKNRVTPSSLQNRYVYMVESEVELPTRRDANDFVTGVLSDFGPARLAVNDIRADAGGDAETNYCGVHRPGDRTCPTCRGLDRI